MSDRPGYWMQETSGVLAPAVRAYLLNDGLSANEIAIIRAYLRQWIMHGRWQGPEIAELRRSVNELTSRRGIAAWLERALDAGIDPL